MTEANDKHIESLRAKVRDERARVAELTSRLGDLKRLLEPASSQLDFVELGFIHPNVLAQRRTPQELARWLAGADAFLKTAIDTREHVECMAKQFGNDARLFDAP
ncbi:hypothetical protein [Bradyrhizobium sp. BR13661]|jgi:hypothetical protein|uniref:hypothetical protein n=1 Tax=Bradyrhizobium sp. BR13661 TaxID=2940622 RepID=UPI002476D0ED|nr:hypothetical protein [Bradyrhizobium sp. BR13661]MDH6261420.1 hypothetical protein [Bradyrhizobium sp. BR13661]